MSSDELDSFRAELMRQKIIFEAELRRQREHFEERIEAITKELVSREADCRNLQSVVTILGKKLDAMVEQHRPATPRRAPTPTRLADREAVLKELKDHRPTRANGGGPAIRQPSPLLSSRSATNSSLNRIPSLTGMHRTSRTSSPAIPGTMHPHRPLLNSTPTNHGGERSARRRVAGAGSARRRNESVHRLASISASDDW